MTDLMAQRTTQVVTRQRLSIYTDARWEGT